MTACRSAKGRFVRCSRTGRTVRSDGRALDGSKGGARERTAQASGFNVDRVLDAYVEAALFAETDEDGRPLDRDFSTRDFTGVARTRMMHDVVTFLNQARAEGVTWSAAHDAHLGRGNVEDQIGHDFWLTRNGHGAGFRDGDWSEPIAGLLHGIAKRMGEVSLYVSRNKINHG